MDKKYHYALTKSERKFVLDNCHRLTDEEIQRTLKELNGTEVSLRPIRRARRNAGLYKKSGHGVCELFGPRPGPLATTE